MAIFRVKVDKNFTILSNALLQDRELSSKSKGVLVTILSLPPDWDINYASILNLIPEGIKFLRTVIKELSELGYIEILQVRQADGKWEEWI